MLVVIDAGVLSGRHDDAAASGRLNLASNRDPAFRARATGRCDLSPFPHGTCRALLAP
jgi:hypothetical protein